ncbi:MAG: endoglycoceramidase [Marmoricola sp.]|nr:endoglycoceramidase [Marmoricola sp.]
MSKRAIAIVALAVASVLGAPTAASATGAPPPVSQTGKWMTDGQGRVVILHGLNQVFKVPPYEPSADGFGDDDATFLAANGFNAVRVGVIWAGVEPQPGVYDDAYLDSIAATVNTLAAHGISSLLDFHQDLYNEMFQGEGAPAWATQSGGLLNPNLGFPFNYFGNLAEDHAWDQFWKNAPAPDGVGLQNHFAAAWKHVAQKFHNDPAVLGYELLNEPWPGTLWEPCAIPLLGCPLFDGGPLTSFYKRVTAAIRTVDPTKTIWFEPTTLFGTVDANSVGSLGDPHTGFAFHIYCATEAETGDNSLCAPLDDLTFATAQNYANARKIPSLMTEFGATNDLPNVQSTVTRADKNMVGWLEWAYTGNDKTSASPDGQALVLDPNQPPTGANVLTAKLKVLAEPYPQAIAGTPTGWSFSKGVFKLSYSTTRVGGIARFPAGSVTQVAVPPIQFPHGYTVQATGAQATTVGNTLQLSSLDGAATVSVTVTANP